MRRLALAVLGVVAVCGAQAQMYKWVDENGRVQYTQTPPPPGRQAQEVKVRPPAARVPATAPSDATAQQKPAQKKGAGKQEEGMSADARTLLGEWRTHMGAPVQIRFSLQQADKSLRSAQTWSKGKDYAAGSGMKVEVSGAKGSGSLSTQGGSDNLPDQVRYERRGDGLILTVDSGPFAGTHLLTSSK